jgi:tetratricopeptide (TPR) repeat protein
MLADPALDVLEAELDNLDAALDRWFATCRAAEGLRLAIALTPLWTRRGYSATGRRWLERMLDLADRTMPPSALRAERAIALDEAGLLADYQWDNEQARTFHQRSVALGRELGSPSILSMVLANLGLAEWVAGHAQQATAFLEEALTCSRTANLPHIVAICLRNLGLIAHSEGQYARAEALFSEAAAQPLPLGWFRGYSLARSLSCLRRRVGPRRQCAARAGHRLRAPGTRLSLRWGDWHRSSLGPSAVLRATEPRVGRTSGWCGCPRGRSRGGRRWCR